MTEAPFWQGKTLEQMTEPEWEALCDGCGRCCLRSFEDEETGVVYSTNVACQLLDARACRCRHYSRRKTLVPECKGLRGQDIKAFSWLPNTCAYRCLAEGRRLPDWHPLISGDAESVHRAGVSVRDCVVSEALVHPDDMEAHIVTWVETG